MNDEKCINPAEIEDNDLLAYLEGDASATISNHVANCRYCQREATALQEMDILLATAVANHACPDSDLLWQFATESLTETSSEHSHIASCPHCQQEVVAIKNALYTPTLATNASTNLNLLEQIQQTGRRVLEAVLLPESPSLAPAFRGQAGTEQIYQVAEYRFILVKTPPLVEGGAWRVEGQIISTENPTLTVAGQIHFYQEETLIYQEAIDELGYFEGHHLPAGIYRLNLELTTPDLSFNISHLTLP